MEGQTPIAIDTLGRMKCIRGFDYAHPLQIPNAQRGKVVPTQTAYQANCDTVYYMYAYHFDSSMRCLEPQPRRVLVHAGPNVVRPKNSSEFGPDHAGLVLRWVISHFGIEVAGDHACN